MPQKLDTFEILQGGFSSRRKRGGLLTRPPLGHIGRQCRPCGRFRQVYPHILQGGLPTAIQPNGWVAIWINAELAAVLGRFAEQKKINRGIYVNPKLEEMLLHLAEHLSKTSGKKVYGYLKADVKAVINSIVDEIAADERISAFYGLWYEQRENVIHTYADELPESVYLSQNKEFKSIKNAVIQEAMNIIADHTPIEDAEELIAKQKIHLPPRGYYTHSVAGATCHGGRRK